ncbi:MAG: Asp-tRNA(Asn)/Glu-tRNA(Gln) amidotransferase subunit GatB [Planctomycetota bacterium]
MAVDIAYEPVIGLEVHVQLKTRSKLFCRCPVGFGAEPNTLTCPVCTGQPGVLPVLNGEALRLAIRAGLALQCEIATRTKFDRKNYFYPDLPKGYQISQFDLPVCKHGSLEVQMDDATFRRVRITRAHLEEDAGKNIHSESTRESWVDLNRAGVPLIEIVGEPDLRSPAEASAYLESLRRLMRYIGVADGDMEKGSLRCDANVSIRPVGDARLGVKVEIKNMNSFRHVENAIAFEIRRQTEVLASGGNVVQETRSWRADSGTTITMRSKETAHDYRYFPEPDLPPFTITSETVASIRRELPELPADRYRRFVDQLGLKPNDARAMMSERDLADYFEAVIETGVSAKTAANWVQTDVLRLLNERRETPSELGLPPRRLGELIAMTERGDISYQAAKQVLPEMLARRQDPHAVAQAMDLLQVSAESALLAIVQRVVERETKVVQDYRSGKATALNALLGRVMRETGGKANPSVVRELLLKALA